MTKPKTKPMVSRDSRITEMVGGGWEVQWTRLLCRPWSGELVRREEKETCESAADAQRFICEQDKRLTADRIFEQFYGGVASVIEWRPLAPPGRRSQMRENPRPIVRGSQCTNYPGSMPNARCRGKAAAWLYPPGWKKPCPGGPVCQECADRITTEYRDKLGEEWTAVPATMM